MAKTLDEYAKENARFLKITNGETFCGTFLSYQFAPDTYNPDKQVVLYKFATDAGRTITWKNSSTGVARTFAKIPENTEVKITRHGDGLSTRYKIETPNSPRLVTKDNPFPEDAPF